MRNRPTIVLRGKELTWDEYKSLNEQMHRMDAWDLLSCYPDSITDEWENATDDMLLRLGEALEESISSDTSEIEWALLEDFGCIKKED